MFLSFVFACRISFSGEGSGVGPRTAALIGGETGIGEFNRNEINEHKINDIMLASLENHDVEGRFTGGGGITLTSLHSRNDSVSCAGSEHGGEHGTIARGGEDGEGLIELSGAESGGGGPSRTLTIPRELISNIRLKNESVVSLQDFAEHNDKVIYSDRSDTLVEFKLVQQSPIADIQLVDGQIIDVEKITLMTSLLAAAFSSGQHPQCVIVNVK